MAKRLLLIAFALRATNASALEFALDIDQARRFNTAVEFAGGELVYRHNGKKFKLIATAGKIIPAAGGYAFSADKGQLQLEFVHLP